MVSTWPWGHVMVGCVLQSGHSHVWWLRAPTDRTVLAHSLVAVPLVALVLVVARAARVSDAGVAFGGSYLSHLPADARYPANMSGARVDSGYSSGRSPPAVTPTPRTYSRASWRWPGGSPSS